MFCLKKLQQIITKLISEIESKIKNKINKQTLGNSWRNSLTKESENKCKKNNRDN